MRRNIYMSVEFYKRLKQKADKNNMSVSEYIRFALENLWKGE